MNLMKRFWWVFVVFGFFVVNEILNFTYYNPAVIVPIYGWAARHGLAKYYESFEKLFTFEEGTLYPLISISRLNKSLFFGPRAAIIGKVAYITKVDDGDYHINVQDEKGDILVAEVIPEYPIKLPPVGAIIKIWGIARFDLAHRWWELHPVIGYQLANPPFGGANGSLFDKKIF